MFSQFKKFMTGYIDINFLEWKTIESSLEVKRFKKGDIILFNGEICRNLYFINSGLARAYLIDGDGKDYTWSIFFNDTNSHMVNLFVVDYDSFINQTPASLHIEALEDCMMISLEYSAIQKLYSKSKKVEKFGRLMAQEAYTYLHKHTVDLKTVDAEARFEHFIKHTPFLLDKVPQYHIASFLGITPQYLSQLKNKMKLVE